MSTHASYKGPADCPAVIPVFPLSGALLLPRGQMPLNIFEPRYLAMVDDAMRTDRIIGMIQPDPEGSGGANPKLYRVGCAGRVTQYAETGDGRYLISLTGITRFRVESELASIGPIAAATSPMTTSLWTSSPGRARSRSTARACSRRCATSWSRTTSRWTGPESTRRPTRRWSTLSA